MDVFLIPSFHMEGTTSQSPMQLYNFVSPASDLTTILVGPCMFHIGCELIEHLRTARAKGGY